MESNYCEYEKKEDGTLVLLSSYGENGIVRPAQPKEGVFSEIGAYCFAPQKGVLVPDDRPKQKLSLLCRQEGDFIDEVILPDTIQKIDSYAFYNCRKLRKLILPSTVQELGSDVFMNCALLSQLKLVGDVRKRSCLRQILTQLKNSVEVSFIGGGEEAVFFFPEFFEGYNEIGPAHIFELNISGEGFRMRQCFSDGILQPAQYDAAFVAACAEEPVANLCQIAWNRLTFPYALLQEHARMYRSFLLENEKHAAKALLKAASYEKAHLHKILYALISQGCFSAEQVDGMVEACSKAGQVETAVCLMKWKEQFLQRRGTERYSLDDL